MGKYDEIYGANIKLKEALRFEQSKESKKIIGSFSALRNSGRAKAQTIQDCIAICRETKERNNKIYREESAKKLNSDVDKLYSEKVKEIVNTYRSEIREIISSQRSAIEEALSVPPSEEQIRLLQALRMEGKSITETELNAILPQLLNNHRAVKALEAIANDNGYSIVKLPQFDYEALLDNLNWTENYLTQRCNDLLSMYTAPGKVEHSTSRLFFGDYEDNEYKTHAVEMFDSTSQTKEIKARVEVNKGLTDVEKAFLESMFNCDPRELKGKVLEAAESPEIKALIKKSDIYAPILAEN